MAQHDSLAILACEMGSEGHRDNVRAARAGGMLRINAVRHIATQLTSQAARGDGEIAVSA